MWRSVAVYQFLFQLMSLLSSVLYMICNAAASFVGYFVVGDLPTCFRVDFAVKILRRWTCSLSLCVFSVVKQFSSSRVRWLYVYLTRHSSLSYELMCHIDWARGGVGTIGWRTLSTHRRGKEWRPQPIAFISSSTRWRSWLGSSLFLGWC